MNETKSDFHGPDRGSVGDPSIAEYAPLIPRYKHLRKIGQKLSADLVRSLSKSDFNDAGAKLGMLQGGTLIFDTEDESSVLMDFCFHDLWRDGCNGIQRFLDRSPPPADSDEMRILQGKLAAHYSLFMIEHVEPGVGVEVQDILYGGRYPIIDVNFSHTAELHVPLAMRIVNVDGIWMSTGAALPADANILTQVRRKLTKILANGLKPKELSPERRSVVNAAIIRACREGGAASRIAYEVSGSGGSGRPQIDNIRADTRIGRNDPCPCGSGKKFKKCCG